MSRSLYVALALGSLLASACGDEPPAREATAPMQTAAPGGSEWERALGPFLTAHWKLPIPSQGEAPAAWSAVERSLAPQDCGTCHPVQWAQWRTSLHAGAYSPGFSGQLIDGPLAAAGELRSCQTCHAPLEEQQPLAADGSANPHYDAALREHGIVCASCHVRAQRRYGPPRRTDAPVPAGPLPHGGFEVREEFQQARFCAPCHQFFDDPGIDGKPVQNTFAEWQASPAAAEGRSCQSCHMPDRAHLWRGIHDPATVRAAVDVELVPRSVEGAALDAALVVHNRDVGHHFPTYVTPRVFLAVWQQDASGEAIAGTRLEATIGREVDFAAQRDVFDTRVPAGESVRLDYRVPRAPGAAALIGAVTVEPDFHYRGVFASLAAQARDPDARARLEEARRRTSASGYVLAEERLALAPTR